MLQGQRARRALKPITKGAKAENLPEFQVFLTCTVNSGPAWITQQDAVFKKKQATNKMVHTCYSRGRGRRIGNSLSSPAGYKS